MTDYYINGIVKEESIYEYDKLIFRKKYDTKGTLIEKEGPTR